MQFWHCITAFGDTILTVPAAFAIAIFLVSAGRHRLMWIWIGVFAAAATLVAMTKLLFMGWCVGIDAIAFTGISGHTTLAAVVFPVLFRLAAVACGPPVRQDAWFAGEAFAVLIGVSRLMIHVHSVAEVVAGLVLGLCLSHLFLRLVRGSMPVVANRRTLLVALLAWSSLASLGPAPTHDLLENLAGWLSGRGEALQQGCASPGEIREATGSGRPAARRHAV
jgi:membrane-associated phospholipid phosphatase